MSVPLNRMANDDALRRVQAGFESVRGVAVTPDFKLYGAMAITEDRPLVDVPEYDGSYDGDIDPVYGPYTYGGTYSQALTYEDFPILNEFGVKGGVTAVSDGEGVPGYLWTYEPSRFVDDLASATVENGYPGMVKKAEQVMVNDFTISIDADDAQAVWQYSANLWLRTNALQATTAATAASGSTSTFVVSGTPWVVNEHAGAFLTVTSGANIGEVIQIASNTTSALTFVGLLPSAIAAAVTGVISEAFTPSLSDRTRERIAGPGTKIFLDAVGGTIGTTEVAHGFISASVTHNNALSAKRFLSDETTMSRKVGRGKRSVTGQIRWEFDSRTQYDNFRNDTPQMVRIQQEGSAINGHATLPNRLARIDLHRVYWGAPVESLRGTNITATFPFRAYYNTPLSKRVAYVAKNTMSVIP
jgi:hypothetical protein